MCGEMVIYSVEKLLKMPNTTQWYDLAWLMIIFVMAFLTSYRLYVVSLESILERVQNDMQKM